MDLNLIRSLVTVVAFATFIGIVWWAYSTPMERHARLGDEE